ncbi:hypothetical protein HMPREF1651_11055, partial [Prevotella bivia DNF00188]
LKGQSAELDRRIALTLAPSEEEETEGMKQEEGLSGNSLSVKVSNEPSPVQNKEEDSHSQSFRPKWRH